MQRHDHRYSAIFIVATLIAFLAVYRDIWRPNHLGTEQLSLQVNQGKLILTEENSSRTPRQHNIISPEFTPLFFLPVPVNSADKQLLATLPTIGPGMAERIIQFRAKNGPIRSDEDFRKISGIGAKRIAFLTKSVSYE